MSNLETASYYQFGQPFKESALPNNEEIRLAVAMHVKGLMCVMGGISHQETITPRHMLTSMANSRQLLERFARLERPVYSGPSVTYGENHVTVHLSHDSMGAMGLWVNPAHLRQDTLTSPYSRQDDPFQDRIINMDLWTERKSITPLAHKSPPNETNFPVID